MAAAPGAKLTPTKELEEVNRLLSLAGYKDVEKLSKCVRAGLIRGHFGFKFLGDPAQLDKVVLQKKCAKFDSCQDQSCTGTLRATVRLLLEQPDYGGHDYEDGSGDAPVACDTCGETRSYVTGCCESSKPSWDDGKFHNHCRECPGLGLCVHDYRTAHCERCGKHYFCGSYGGSCSCGSGRRN